ncbi:MAG: 16S rRNA (guanine(966)-N(2))-methyltransferase RsmD [Nitrospirota bacterium]
MRVVGGIAKGRRLKSLKGLNIRPTSDKVKESIFNILGNKIVDAVFLDLCAGAGGIGIEALSRGAKETVLVENTQRAVKLIKGNLLLCNLEKDSKVVCNDAVRFLEDSDKRFDIIFFDPPYKSDLFEKAMAVFDRKELLNNNGILIIEHNSRTVLPEETNSLILLKKYKYGDTTLSLYKERGLR